MLPVHLFCSQVQCLFGPSFLWFLCRKTGHWWSASLILSLSLDDLPSSPLTGLTLGLPTLPPLTYLPSLRVNRLQGQVQTTLLRVFPLLISGLDISQVICPKFSFILQHSDWKLSDELEYWATASVFKAVHKWCCLLLGVLDSERVRPAGLILSSLVVSSIPFPLRQL